MTSFWNVGVYSVAGIACVEKNIFLTERSKEKNSSKCLVLKQYCLNLVDKQGKIIVRYLG